ncbi:hypothetical protein [Kitasatospora herbaricolor]|uniref:Uncharacterized protein n=1 Tax=Kitasatospora herbaricolor TaxID=68217 RepID=A0ABZ1WLX2_9ACTN|nr:hypothetical protein [Kitasatospora herbaricolor]
MSEQWISGMAFSTFSPERSESGVPVELDPREAIRDVAVEWQGRSAHGGTVGNLSFQSLHEAGRRDAAGVALAVNRVVEVHGLMGSIGEQLALAWAAELDAQRWRATAPAHDGPEQLGKQQLRRMATRGLCEMSTHFLLGASHSLANLVLRVVLLDTRAAGVIEADREGRRAGGFLPGTTNRRAWPTFSPSEHSLWNEVLPRAAAAGADELAAVVARLLQMQRDQRFVSLDDRRSMDYHRHRPQSLSHTSPRSGIASFDSESLTLSVDLPSHGDDAEHDERRVHAVALEALDLLKDTMEGLDPLLEAAARACHVDWAA